MYYYDPPSGRRMYPTTQDLKKIIACIAIVTVVLLAKRWDTPATNFVVSRVRFVVSEYNIDPQRIYVSLQEAYRDLPAVPVFQSARQELLLELPVNGELTSPFGRRWHPILNENRMHNGIDISAPEGTPVRAALDGVVVEVAEEKELGKVIRIRHSHGITTVYGHLKDVYVRAEDLVKQGLIIGTVGNTGLSEAPHLHFELWERDEARDPEKWLKLQ